MKKASILLLATIVFIQANAQKLPIVQQASLRAPANVKIDGKPLEWVQMKSYNEATELKYTVANDNEKLYLVAQTDNAEVYNRICNGGIKFVIQKNGSKSDDGASFVKFPFFKEHRDFMFDFNKTGYAINIGPAGIQTTIIPVKEVTSTQQADSVMNSHNKLLREKLKFIYTYGITGVDNELPIYNNKGIEAAVAFDTKKVYTCEMAIDMQLLGLTTKPGEKFAYQIMINGDPYKVIMRSPFGGASPESFTTDFWGEYTLAK